MVTELSKTELGRLARLGAAARLGQLEREIAALRRAFPGLKAASTPPGAAAAPKADRAPRSAVTARVSKRGRRKPMSAAERQAVSDRMKHYWDDRRKSRNTE